MLITITSIRLKSLFGFFRLSNHGRKISKQAKQSKGFVKMKNTGFGYEHFTLSVWENAEDRKAFYISGAHKEAMKESARLATELRFFTYEADALPNWKEAKAILHEKGRLTKL